MRIITPLILFLSTQAHAMEVGMEYRLNAYYPEASYLVFQPQSRTSIAMTIKKGQIPSRYQKTVIDLNLRILTPCVLSCDVEIIRINDVIAPAALPSALTKKPDLISIKPGLSQTQ
jgi:hypothetical protein